MKKILITLMVLTSTFIVNAQSTFRYGGYANNNRTLRDMTNETGFTSFYGGKYGFKQENGKFVLIRFEKTEFDKRLNLDKIVMELPLSNKSNEEIKDIHLIYLKGDYYFLTYEEGKRIKVIILQNLNSKHYRYDWKIIKSFYLKVERGIYNIEESNDRVGIHKGMNDHEIQMFLGNIYGYFKLWYKISKTNNQEHTRYWITFSYIEVTETDQCKCIDSSDDHYGDF